MLIINADDFGKDKQTNLAIVECFKKGLCSSTTLMPNMPFFEEACQLVRENKLLNHVGMHLVLTSGNPLTEEIKNYPHLFGVKAKRRSAIFVLDKKERRALAEEIRAQIKRCKAFGMPLTHIDSHHSVHTNWAISTLLINIAKDENIPYIRIHPYVGFPGGSFRISSYALFFNFRLKIMSMARTQYLCSLKNYLLLKQKKNLSVLNKSLEIIVHPGLNSKNTLIDVGNEDIDKGLEEMIISIDNYKEASSFTGT